MNELFPINSSVSGVVTNILFDTNSSVSANNVVIEIDPAEDKLKLFQLGERIKLQKTLNNNTYGAFRNSKKHSLNEAVLVTKKYLEYLSNIHSKAESKFKAGILEEEIDFYQLTAEKQEAENNLKKAERNYANFNIETDYDEASSTSALEMLASEQSFVDRKIKSCQKIKAPFDGVFYPSVSIGQYIKQECVLFYLVRTDF